MAHEFPRPGGASRSSGMVWLRYDSRARAIVYQVLLAAALALAFWFVVANTAENLAARGIASGFQFLFREAGFEISETTFLSYDAGNSYLRAIAVGVLNTFRVAAIGIVLATSLGDADRPGAALAQLAAWDTRGGLRRADPQRSVARPALLLVRRRH